MSNDILLDVRDLHVEFHLDEGVLRAVSGVSYTIDRNTTLGIVGESGCGKSITAHAVLRIVPPPGRTGGRILLHREAGGHGFGREAGNPSESSGIGGEEIGEEGTAAGPSANVVDLQSLGTNSSEMRAIRGREIAMIFQEPMTSLSPVHKVGAQVAEAILLHRTEDQAEAKEIAMSMLDRVGIPHPSRVYDTYPHQLSGGLRQRIMIAMALSCDPSLLIADEPTTALDVTVQAQVIELMKELQAQSRMAIQYISHDLGVIAEIADMVAVMYLGEVVEYADVHTLFKQPLHPYTSALLSSIPKLEDTPRSRLFPITGTVPTPINLPKGCRFFGRCPHAMPGTCDAYDPALLEIEKGHKARCFLYPEVLEAAKRKREVEV
jgi:oligopeptide/dipeptide ABC transporter ATP-binding protein